MNLDGAPQPIRPVETAELSLADRWILARLDEAIREVGSAIDRYEFNAAALRIYNFIWHEYCDWYLELAKQPLRDSGVRQAAARYVAVRCLDGLLRALHPFMPFITEDIWQALRGYVDEPALAPHLAIARYPEPGPSTALNEKESAAMLHCIAVTEAINSLRSLLGYHPRQRVEARVRLLGADGSEDAVAAFRAEFEQWKPYAATLARTASLGLAGPSEGPPRGMVTALLGWCEVSVMAPEGFDFERARAAIRKKLGEVAVHHEQHQARLRNPDFLAKAAPEMREQIEQRAQGLAIQKQQLSEQLDLLEQAN
jgi:valyl-tRNA synthetase